MADVYDRSSFIISRPTQAYTDSNFNSTIRYNLTTSSNQNGIPRNTTHSLTFEIPNHVHNGAIAPKISSTLKGGLTNFAQYKAYISGNIYFNNTKVGSITDYPQTCTLQTVLYDDRNELTSNSSSNAFSFFPLKKTNILMLPDVYNESVVAAPTASTGNQHEIYAAQNNLAKSGYFNADTITAVTLTCPIPFLLETEIIPENCMVTIELNVNSNFYRDILQFTSGGGATDVLNIQNSGAPADINATNNLGFKIIDSYISFNVVNIIPVPRSVPLTLKNTELYTISHAVPGGEGAVSDTWQCTVKRGTYRIFISFYNSTSAIDSDITKYVNPNITYLSFNFGGNQYPNTPYTNSPQDRMRAYNDLVRVTNQLDRGGFCMSYLEWTNNPIYAFDVSRAPGSVSNTLDLKIDVANNVVGLQCFVAAQYDKEFIINYNENHQINTVTVNEV